ECPNVLIVWVNSIDQLVTNRREPRENRRTSRAKSIYRFNFLLLLRLCLLCKSFLFLGLSGTRVIILYLHVFIEVADTCRFRSIRNVCKWRHDKFVCVF
ncbi:hypothetical protein BE221DRAFT_72728, partial [Ostreococcus tauri]